PARVVYFATSPNGVITQLVPLREPLLNDSAVLTRAQEGMTSAFDISYVNWRQDEQQAVKYFTAAGYRSYQATLV
ncbi:DotI/IcmL/TraM family protein, partial [Acidithiobacillus ferridurans]|nr:DotI/IcmL/TraM family protein [Acidithiobacillus ferridurans]